MMGCGGPNGITGTAGQVGDGMGATTSQQMNWQEAPAFSFRRLPASDEPFSLFNSCSKRTPQEAFRTGEHTAFSDQIAFEMDGSTYGDLQWVRFGPAGTASELLTYELGVKGSEAACESLTRQMAQLSLALNDSTFFWQYDKGTWDEEEGYWVAEDDWKTTSYEPSVDHFTGISLGKAGSRICNTLLQIPCDHLREQFVQDIIVAAGTQDQVQAAMPFVDSELGDQNVYNGDYSTFPALGSTKLQAAQRERVLEVVDHYRQHLQSQGFTLQ